MSNHKTFIVEVKYLDPYPKCFEKRIEATSVAMATYKVLKDFQKSRYRKRLPFKLTVTTYKI